MDSTKRRADTRAFFDEGDPAIKIIAAEKDVIEQGRHLIRRPGYRRRENSSSGQGKEKPTRHHRDCLSVPERRRLYARFPV